jgi:hypothetical protein
MSFMSCWKTINLVKDYGGMRIVLTAVSLMILFFIPEYLAMQLIHPQTVQRGDHALLFAGLLVAAIIAHKILHILPLISKKKIRKKDLLVENENMERSSEKHDACLSSLPFFRHHACFILRGGCDAELCSLFLHHFKHSFRLLSA